MRRVFTAGLLTLCSLSGLVIGAVAAIPPDLLAGAAPQTGFAHRAAPSQTSGPLLAQDAFHRADQALWGTASDGHTWGADALFRRL